MIVIDEKIVGIWTVQTMPGQNWMAGIRELVPDQKYELVYRFRYEVDDKVFDSEDHKSWYEGVLSGTRNYVLQSFRQVAHTLAATSVGPLYEILNENGDLKDFQRRLFDCPPMHARMVPSK